MGTIVGTSCQNSKKSNEITGDWRREWESTSGWKTASLWSSGYINLACRSASGPHSEAQGTSIAADQGIGNDKNSSDPFHECCPFVVSAEPHSRPGFEAFPKVLDQARRTLIERVFDPKHLGESLHLRDGNAFNSYQNIVERADPGQIVSAFLEA
jgi:hypothetical protein